MTASAASSGISHSAASDGPARSPAPAKALRRTGPNRAKSTSRSSGSVVFVVRLFMPGRLSGADDADRVIAHLGIDDIEQATPPRVANQNEARAVQRIGVVSA